MYLYGLYPEFQDFHVSVPHHLAYIIHIQKKYTLSSYYSVLQIHTLFKITSQKTLQTSNKTL